MSYVIMSFKNMPVIKLLKLQDEDMPSPYDKKILSRLGLHCALRANSQHVKCDDTLRLGSKDRMAHFIRG